MTNSYTIHLLSLSFRASQTPPPWLGPPYSAAPVGLAIPQG